MDSIISNLISDYSNWRLTKSAKNARIPSDLIKRTIEVNNQFPEEKLKSLLGLSVPTWKKITSQASITEGKKQAFSDKKIKTKQGNSKFLKLENLEPNAASQNEQNSDNRFMNKAPVLVMNINNIQIQIFN